MCIHDDFMRHLNGLFMNEYIKINELPDMNKIENVH